MYQDVNIRCAFPSEPTPRSMSDWWSSLYMRLYSATHRWLLVKLGAFKRMERKKDFLTLARRPHSHLTIWDWYAIMFDWTWDISDWVVAPRKHQIHDHTRSMKRLRPSGMSTLASSWICANVLLVQLCFRGSHNYLSRRSLSWWRYNGLCHPRLFEQIYRPDCCKQIQPSKLLVLTLCPTSILINWEHNRSGRWRSEYRIDLEGNKVEGKILVNVHYYEQGNVRLLLSPLASDYSLPTANAMVIRFNYLRLMIHRSHFRLPSSLLLQNRKQKNFLPLSKTRRENIRSPWMMRTKKWQRRPSKAYEERYRWPGRNWIGIRYERYSLCDPGAYHTLLSGSWI